MRRDLYEPDHEAFREVVRAYVKREVTPNQQRWDQEHIVDRQAWLAAGKQAIIGHLIPERFGGLGTEDFRFRCVAMEEIFEHVGDRGAAGMRTIDIVVIDAVCGEAGSESLAVAASRGITETFEQSGEFGLGHVDHPHLAVTSQVAAVNFTGSDFA